MMKRIGMQLVVVAAVAAINWNGDFVAAATASGWAFQEETEQAQQQQGLSEFLQQLRQLIDTGQIRDAATWVDESTAPDAADSPDPEDVFRARQVVAAGFERIQDFRSAYEQRMKLLDYQLDRIDDERVQRRLTTTLVVLGVSANRVNESDEMVEVYDRAIEALEPITDFDSLSQSLSRLTVITNLKAQLLVNIGKLDQATEMLDEYLPKVQKLFEANPENATAVQLYARMIAGLMRATPDEQRKDDLYEQHQTMVQERLDNDPANIGLTVQYLSAASFQLNRLLNSDPEAARPLLDDFKERIENIIAANPSAQRSMQQFARALPALEQKIDSAITIKDLIGKDAPPLAAEYWVAGPETQLDELKGNVVLMQFWAVGHRPSFDTFVDLRKFRESYEPRGLKFLGVTRHFGLVWNDQLQQPQRAEEPVTPEDENLVIEKFLEQREWKHPTMIVPGNSDMIRNYGVAGLPHTVIIDRAGKVRLVESGVSPGWADTIEAMIQKLLDEDN